MPLDGLGLFFGFILPQNSFILHVCSLLILCFINDFFSQFIEISFQKISLNALVAKTARLQAVPYMLPLTIVNFRAI